MELTRTPSVSFSPTVSQSQTLDFPSWGAIPSASVSASARASQSSSESAAESASVSGTATQRRSLTSVTATPFTTASMTPSLSPQVRAFVQFDAIVINTDADVSAWTVPLAAAFRKSLVSALGITAARIFIVSVTDAHGDMLIFESLSPTNSDPDAFSRRLVSAPPAFAAASRDLLNLNDTIQAALPENRFRVVFRLFLADTVDAEVATSATEALSALVMATPDSALFAGVSVPGALNLFFVLRSLQYILQSFLQPH